MSPLHNSYDQIAGQWHSQSRGQEYVDRVLRYVDLILRDLEPGARVLDLGCGTGEPVARHVANKGFKVTGIDQSEKMLEIAREIVPEGEFIHDDAIDVELPSGFKAAIAWDSLFHVPRVHHSAIYRKLSNSLECGARLLLSVGGSGDEGFTSEMFGHTFFYSGFEPAEARQILEAEGFAIELWEIDEPYDRGHIAVIARKT